MPMTSSTAGHAFHVGSRPPSGPTAGFPVDESGTNHSALRYQSGSVLMIGPGLEGLSFVSQGLFATNRIFLVSTVHARAVEWATILAQSSWLPTIAAALPPHADALV